MSEHEQSGGLIYAGRGAYIPGVPARDLDADEVKAFDRAALLDSGIYVAPPPRRPQQNQRATGPAENKER